MSFFADKENIFGLVGGLMLAVGSYLALFVVPSADFFGETGRILFAHVPAAWGALVVFTASFVLAIGTLVTRSRRWDAGLEASVEVGVLLTLLLIAQGALWARPTFGVYWTWDPRLTTSAIMLVAFAGVLSLRSFAEDFGRRAVWTAAATIVAYIDVPLVYFIVKIAPRGIHQEHSSPETVSEIYHLPLRLNAFAVLFLATWMIIKRARVALLRDAAAHAEPSQEGEGGEALVAGRDAP